MGCSYLAELYLPKCRPGSWRGLIFDGFVLGLDGSLEISRTGERAKRSLEFGPKRYDRRQHPLES